LNHASIIDGCRLSRAAIKVFKHKDVADCERLCKETENWPGHKLLITDGVFPMEKTKLFHAPEKIPCRPKFLDQLFSPTGESRSVNAA